MKIVLKLAGAKERTEGLISRNKTKTKKGAADTATEALDRLGLLNTSMTTLPIRGNFEALVMNITRAELRRLYEERYLSYGELAALFSVDKAKIERWLKHGKNDNDILPIRKIDFWRIEESAPKEGARWQRILSHAIKA